MKIIYSFKSILGPLIVQYLSLKQSLGRRYGTEYYVFKSLDSFLHEMQSDLTSESFTKWFMTKQHLSSTGRRERMRIIYNLCLYRRRTEPFCFIPDRLQFPSISQTVRPYIFSEPEIIQLFNAIDHLGSNTKSPLRRNIIRLALILVYTSGLRRSELLNLQYRDYDSKEHTILIRESKYHKSRLIPLSQDAWTALEDSIKLRHKFGLPISMDSPLIFTFYRGKIKAYSFVAIWRNFKIIFKNCNIKTMCGCLPRLHDMRHSFAVHALLRWYNEGADVQAKLPVLATYMGHVSVASTQYYLRFIQNVVNAASERFEALYGTLIEFNNNVGDIQ